MSENRIRTSARNRRPPLRPDEVVSLAPRARSSTPTLETSSPPERVSPAAVDSATATDPVLWGRSHHNLIVERSYNGEPDPPLQPLAPGSILSDNPENLPDEEMPALMEPDSSEDLVNEQLITALPSSDNSSDDEAYEADAQAYEADFRASQMASLDRRLPSPDEEGLIESMHSVRFTPLETKYIRTQSTKPRSPKPTLSAACEHFARVLPQVCPYQLQQRQYLMLPRHPTIVYGKPSLPTAPVQGQVPPPPFQAPSPLQHPSMHPSQRHPPQFPARCLSGQIICRSLLLLFRAPPVWGLCLCRLGCPSCQLFPLGVIYSIVWSTKKAKCWTRSGQWAASMP